MEENRCQKRDVIRSTEIGIQDVTPSVPVSGASLNLTSTVQPDRWIFSAICPDWASTSLSCSALIAVRLDLTPSLAFDLAVEETSERTAKQTPRTVNGATDRVPVAEGVPPSVPKSTTERKSESVAKEASATTDEFFRARFRSRVSDRFLVADQIDARRKLLQLVSGLRARKSAGGNSKQDEKQCSEDRTLDHLAFT